MPIQGPTDQGRDLCLMEVSGWGSCYLLRTCEHREAKLRMGAGLFLPRANVGLGTMRQGLRAWRVWRTGWRLSVGMIKGGKHPREVGEGNSVLIWAPV